MVALVVCAIVWCIALTSLVSSSGSTTPLRAVSRPSQLSLEILPRQPGEVSPSPSSLLPTDSFRLTFSAFGRLLHLHLQPNEHLIHPSARINKYRNGPDGQAVLQSTIPLQRNDVRAYSGVVMPTSLSAQRWREDAAGAVRPISGQDNGWAHILVHDPGDGGHSYLSFEGSFAVHGDIHHIKTEANYFRQKHTHDPIPNNPRGPMDSKLIIYRDSDTLPNPEHVESVTRRCSHDSLDFNTNPYRNGVLRGPRQTPSWPPPRFLDFGAAVGIWDKRDDVAGGATSSNFSSSIGQTTGCPSASKVVYMGVAADCRYTMTYGSVQDAITQILNNWNIVSSLYKNSFNISLGIIHLDVHEPTCPNPIDTLRPWNTDCNNITLNDRLSLFSRWRGTLGNDGTGLWHLMSGCPSGTEVGVAWLGTLCEQSASGDADSTVSGTAVSTSGRTEWEVVAHEIGHNFGAIHDCQESCNNTPCCPLSNTGCSAGDAFIMSPVTSSSQTLFSPCSVGNVCSLMAESNNANLNTSCVQQPDSTKEIISLKMCGNGIVEDGEQCDPGSSGNSTCCDPATCQFRGGAVCDPTSSPCCTDRCQFSPSSQICRPSIDNFCDAEEFCTGNSSTCPPNIVTPNGRKCGSGLACASGQCTSESRQCQTVGASLALKQVCPRIGNSCQISCQDPTTANQCIQLQSQWIDGSPCGLGGVCLNGSCRAGSALATVKAWYLQNLQISIPITVVIGIFALLFLWTCVSFIRRWKVKRSKRQDFNSNIPHNLGPQRITSVQHLQMTDSRPRRFNMGNQVPARQVIGSRNTSLPDHSRTQNGSRRDEWVNPQGWNGPPLYG